MENKLDKEIVITPSLCDGTGRLGYANAFALFMDIASEHAENIGFGNSAMMQKGLFWLTVRTRICFYKRPRIMSATTVSTWPGRAEKVRCMRYYTLTQNDELLLEGKTEWAVMDMKTGRLHGIEELYPKELVVREETACNKSFMRIDENFSGADELEKYRVRSTDIDLGGHMNNAAYIRALMGAFSSAEQKALGINEMDVCFRAPCFENDVLSIMRRRTDSGLELGMVKPDGKAAALISVF